MAFLFYSTLLYTSGLELRVNIAICGTLKARVDLVEKIIVFNVFSTIFVPFFITVLMDILIVFKLMTKAKALRQIQRRQSHECNLRSIKKDENEDDDNESVSENKLPNEVKKKNTLTLSVNNMNLIAVKKREKSYMKTPRMLLTLSTAFLLLNMPLVILKFKYFTQESFSLRMFCLIECNNKDINEELAKLLQDQIAERFTCYL